MKMNTWKVKNYGLFVFFFFLLMVKKKKREKKKKKEKGGEGVQTEKKGIRCSRNGRSEEELTSFFSSLSSHLYFSSVNPPLLFLSLYLSIYIHIHFFLFSFFFLALYFISASLFFFLCAYLTKIIVSTEREPPD